MENTILRRPLAALATLALAGGALMAGAAPASAALPAAGSGGGGDAAPLTNLAHLDFLLDTASPEPVDGHTTYRLEEEPELVLPWTYADARDGGAFERIGGGQLDPATGDWSQGAYNADDVSRAAVVYIRHWAQTGDATSRDTAYELLRALAYLQTADGEHAGNVVLWMQPDGGLNPSAEPVELPDPSDSDASYWLARTIWALGEGYAAFARSGADAGDAEDAAFAAFLRERLDLAIGAVDRQVLDEYGVWEESDGVRVPAWLIVDGADASSEAMLGLAAYVETSPDASAARTQLARLAEGVAAMSAGSAREWPYSAVMPWTRSSSMWHAWASQQPAALAVASRALGDPSLARPAIAEATTLAPLMLASGGPDNAWFPTPIERVQIAYGADSRLQSWLAVGDAAGSAGIRALAALEAAWYFGSNRSGAVMYDRATGVTYDGLQADGSVNRNSGAESTIHGLLSMIALDANPDVRDAALAATEAGERDGLAVVEAEAATSTTGEVVTPESAWTGEAQFGGGAYLALDRGGRATFELGASSRPRWVEPVVHLEPGERTTSIWTTGRLPIGAVSTRGPQQGVSEVPGVLRPEALTIPVPASRSEVAVRSLSAQRIDALLVRPVVTTWSNDGARPAQLVASSALLPQRVRVGWAGAKADVLLVSADGATRASAIRGEQRITLKPGWFALVRTAG